MRHALVGVLMLAGCSGPELTCELMADPTNCFAEQAAALAACMPMRATPAALSADETTCTFADGVRLVFNTTVSSFQQKQQAGGAKLTVYNSNGSVCGELVAEVTSGGYQIAINNGVDLNDGAEWNMNYDVGTDDLQCTSKIYTASMSDINACPSAATLPGFGYTCPVMIGSLASPPYSFTLTSATTSGTLFTCQ
jgi:hypothetical protein